MEHRQVYYEVKHADGNVKCWYRMGQVFEGHLVIAGHEYNARDYNVGDRLYLTITTMPVADASLLASDKQRAEWVKQLGKRQV